LGDEFKYVVSQIVVDEIDARIHTKYSGKMLHYFEDLPYHHLLQEFANGSVKESRKAKNAMNEINYLFTVLDAFRTGKSTETKDKEIRDREIAMQYRRFGEEANGEVIILTADKDMAFHAQAQGISSIYYKLPHRLEVDRIDPLKIPDLFYDLTTALGIIKVGNTIILGEWRGKSVDDYIKERLRIYNVEDSFAKEIEVCRGILNEL
jgi:rRNA-processing protein FCF1